MADGDHASGGRRPWDTGHVGLNLPTGVIDLHPHFRTSALCGIRPFAERPDWGLCVENDAGRPGQRLRVNHDVAGDDRSHPSSAPAVVQLDQLFAGELSSDGHVLLHGCLDHPVGECRPTGKSEWGEGRRDCAVSLQLVGCRVGEWHRRS